MIKQIVTPIIKTVVKVLPKVKLELFAARLKTCATCLDRQTDLDVGWTCGEYLAETKETCGCMVREKAKLKGFNCPQNKWPKEK